MKRVYKIDESIVSKYMDANKMSNQSIVDEREDFFLVKKGNGMSPLSKNEVEKWALDNGLVAGYGNQHQPIESITKREETSKAAHTPENYKKYEDQTTEGRLANAKELASENLSAQADPYKGAKGNFSYPKGKDGKRLPGTNK